MEFCGIVCLAIALTLIPFSSVSGILRQDQYTVEKLCSEVYNVTTTNSVPYLEQYYKRNWFGAKRKEYRMRYRLESHTTHHTRKVCCEGYISYNSDSCIASCSKGCGLYGACVKPETCMCEDGYKFNEDTSLCEPLCYNECVNGICTKPNECTCQSGYTLSEDNFTCVPSCTNCQNLEFCVEPHICRCINSYERSPMDRIDRSAYVECKPVCDMPCINASCVEPNVCKCHEGFMDFDNDTFACEPKCNVAEQEKYMGSQGCLNGECVEPEVCKCYPGFQLSLENPYVCDPVCSKGCVHGKCVMPDTCACEDGYVESEEVSNVCVASCSSGCPNGTCVKPEVCQCHQGFQLDSSGGNHTATCVPLCSETCVQGLCTAPETCSCFEGFHFENGSRTSCEPICKENCINGFCDGPDTCRCNEGYVKDEEAGDNNTCIASCECENGYCDKTSSKCSKCFDGYALEDAGNLKMCKAQCKGGCENGECIGPGECRCNENYVSSNDTEGNSVCIHPCGSPCVHGTCVIEESVCNCFYGWNGKFCDDAVLCLINLFRNESEQLSANLSESSNEPSDNSSSIALDEPWKGPICDNECKGYLNESKCTNASWAEYPVCFISKDSKCNVNTKSPYVSERENTLLTSAILISTTGALLIGIAAASVALFLMKKKKVNNATNLRTLARQEKPNREQECLVEEDGIYL